MARSFWNLHHEDIGDGVRYQIACNNFNSDSNNFAPGLKV